MGLIIIGIPPLGGLIHAFPLRRGKEPLTTILGGVREDYLVWWVAIV
jgi:hypothetical protein